jgi:hypothetical protein
MLLVTGCDIRQCDKSGCADFASEILETLRG